MTFPRRLTSHRIWEDNLRRTHRVGGPAIEWDDGSKSWHWRGGIMAYDIRYANGDQVKFIPTLQTTFPGYEEAT